MVNLAPDPVRQSLQAAVRSRLRVALMPGHGPPDAAEESAAVWSALRGLGAAALDAPMTADGLGLGLSASSAVAEELGRAGLDGRYLAVALAIDAAATGVSDPLLRDLVAGDVPVTLAGFERTGELVQATVDDTGKLSLSGQLPVDSPAGTDGERVLVPVGLGGGQIGLILLDVGALDVRAQRQPSGAGGLASLSGAACPDTTLLCRWDAAVLCPEGVIGRGRVRQAAYLLGIARGALATAVRYAADRRQFGQPLREFQSVAFRLATCYAQLEALRLAVARVVWLADNGRRFGRPAAEALAQAAETAIEIGQRMMQLCGARGMTVELPAHRYYLRTRREAGRLGSSGRLWREVGRDQLSASRHLCLDGRYGVD